MALEEYIEVLKEERTNLLDTVEKEQGTFSRIIFEQYWKERFVERTNEAFMNSEPDDVAWEYANAHLRDFYFDYKSNPYQMWNIDEDDSYA